MCREIDDDFIEELAIGRGQGTKEEAHALECGECQERLRQSREWIATFRQACAELGKEPQTKKKPMKKSNSLPKQPLLRTKRSA